MYTNFGMNLLYRTVSIVLCPAVHAPHDVLCRGAWTAGHKTTKTVWICHSWLHTTTWNILLMPNVEGVVCAHSWLIRPQVYRGQLSRQGTLLSVAIAPLIYTSTIAVKLYSCDEEGAHMFHGIALHLLDPYCCGVRSETSLMPSPHASPSKKRWTS